MTRILIRLRLERMMQGQTQTELARIANMSGCLSMSQDRISKLERAFPPRPGEAEILSGILGIPPENLFERVSRS
jgi:transcriptional regulator with XRE-family HTH domain